LYFEDLDEGEGTSSAVEAENNCISTHFLLQHHLGDSIITAMILLFKEIILLVGSSTFRLSILDANNLNMAKYHNI